MLAEEADQSLMGQLVGGDVIDAGHGRGCHERIDDGFFNALHGGFEKQGSSRRWEAS